MIGTSRKVRLRADPKPCDLTKNQNRLSGLVIEEFETDLLSEELRNSYVGGEPSGDCAASHVY